jgi:hypothetical protein
MALQRLISGLGAFAVFTSSFGGIALARTSHDAVYRVTVQNVTAGNVLSPFLAVIHAAGRDVAAVGSVASPGVAALAETGDRTLLIDELSTQSSQVVAADGGAITTGESRTVDITVPAALVKAGVNLSVLAMIGRSNDSFVKFGAFPLGHLGTAAGNRLTAAAQNFDAGSEENTGNIADFGPSGHPVEAAEGRITYDRGLNLRGDAPEVLGWGSTAALVSIQRIR